MTTIAFDGFTLAADTLITNGDCVFGELEKIHVLDDGRLFAAAGAMDVVFAVKDWLNGGEKPEIKDNDTFIGIVISAEDNGYVANEISAKLRLFPACIPWAGGTGEPYALTAMKCGKEAREAVEIACKMDIRSGGKVTFNNNFDTR